jgi:Undecaprenyl-phosphate glucose phosphotransferase
VWLPIRSDLNAMASDAVSYSRTIEPAPQPSKSARRCRRTISINYQSIRLLAPIADGALIVFIAVACWVSYHNLIQRPANMAEANAVGAISAAFFILAMKGRGLYEPRKLLGRTAQIRACAATWAGCMLLVAYLGFSLKLGSEVSRGAALIFAPLGLIAVIVSRLIWRNMLADALSGGRLVGPKVAIITDEDPRNASWHAILLERYGFHIVNRISLPRAAWDSEEALRQHLFTAFSGIRGSPVDEVFIEAEWCRAQRIIFHVEALRTCPLPVHIIPEVSIQDLIRRDHQQVGPLVAVQIKRAPLDQAEQILKRSADVIVAGAAVLVLFPLFLAAAAAIWIEDGGPAIFKQRRRGFNGREFTILKFRSMRVLEDGLAVRQATRNDTRVTKCGYWLRRTSIDELPQLLNVLIGDMSIVGPRPHAIAHDNEYIKTIATYALRQNMKPGLTGWAQIHGFRGETATLASMEKRVSFDIWYISHWSFRLDVQIFLRTITAVIKAPNAY